MGAQVQPFEGMARAGGFFRKSKMRVDGQSEARGRAGQADPSPPPAGGGVPWTRIL